MEKIMSGKLSELKDKHPEKVRAILNLLVESPYFYRSDDEDSYLFLRRNQQEFRDFFREWYGWDLVVDDKCARVFKDEWFNAAITPANRLQFRLGKRDECIAFMLLIEYFEKILEDNAMTAEDPGNPMFKFGDLLEFQRGRFQELFKDDTEKYTAEHIQRNILLPLMPQLIKYRFLRELPRPKGLRLTREQYIYEMLPALYHYNTGRLAEAVSVPDGGEADAMTEEEETAENPPEVNDERE
jgi:hypothetical protein